MQAAMLLGQPPINELCCWIHYSDGMAFWLWIFDTREVTRTCVPWLWILSRYSSLRWEVTA
jgi:hypothetical protein